MKRVLALLGTSAFVLTGLLFMSESNQNPLIVALRMSTRDAASRKAPSNQCARMYEQFPSHPGFIDTTGKEVIRTKYEDTGSFHEGRASFRKRDGWGFIDKHGKEVIEPKFSRVRDFSEGLAAVRENKCWGFIDKSGNFVIKPTNWCSTTDFRSGIAVVGVGTKFGIIDNAGHFIIPADLASVESIEDGAYRISRSKKFGFTDKFGQITVEPKYDDAKDFSEGLAPVLESGKWGYIDKVGMIAIAPRFSHAQRFAHGNAVVGDGAKFYLIDREGSRVGKADFSYMTAILKDDVKANLQYEASLQDFTPVAYGAGWTFINNRTGAELGTSRFASVESFSEGLACVKMYDNPKVVIAAAAEAKRLATQAEKEELEQEKADAIEAAKEAKENANSYDVNTSEN